MNSSTILKVNSICRTFLRNVGRDDRFHYELEESLLHQYEKKIWKKPRLSKYNMKVSRIKLPTYLEESMANQLKSSEFDEANSEAFAEYLWKRRPDLKTRESQKLMTNVETNLQVTGRLPTDRDYTSLEDRIIQKALLRDVFYWQKITYDRPLSLSYLHARGPPDYVSLIRVLSEIKKKDESFTPRTVYDFGSGVGTSFWAIDTLWPGDCEDLMTVDESTDMNDLSETILNECKEKMAIPSSIRRDTFIGQSSMIKYDLVISSRSMLEVNETRQRCTISDLLWQKVAENGYLVLIEGGSFSSYKSLLECREFLLEFYLRKSKEPNPKIEMFAPCPHSQLCPIYNTEQKLPCYFTQKMQREFRNDLYDAFSFFIFKKQVATVQYCPRILKCKTRGGHNIYITCTPEGTVEESVVTKGKTTSEVKSLTDCLDKGDHFPARVSSSSFIYNKEKKVPFKIMRGYTHHLDKNE